MTRALTTAFLFVFAGIAIALMVAHRQAQRFDLLDADTTVTTKMWKYPLATGDIVDLKTGEVFHSIHDPGPYAVNVNWVKQHPHATCWSLPTDIQKKIGYVKDGVLARTLSLRIIAKGDNVCTDPATGQLIRAACGNPLYEETHDGPVLADEPGEEIGEYAPSTMPAIPQSFSAKPTPLIGEPTTVLPAPVLQMPMAKFPATIDGPLGGTIPRGDPVQPLCIYCIAKTPTDGPADAPEPTSWLMMASGVGVMLWRKKWL